MDEFCIDCGLDFQCCIHRYKNLIHQETLTIYSLCPAVAYPDAICLCSARQQEYLQELYREVMETLSPEIPLREPGLTCLRFLYREKILWNSVQSC